MISKEKLMQSKLLALLILIVLSACTDTDPPNPTLPPIGGMPMNANCISDNACATGFVCVNANCIPGECNKEKTCLTGICNPVSYTCPGSQMTTCSDNNGCSNLPGTVCISGTCTPGDCVVETDCNPGQSCNAQYRCVTQTACIDGDRDGYGLGCTNGDDCDDNNAQINPGIVENATTLCDDNLDNDCKNGQAVCGDEDLDGDGFSSKTGDCDENNAQVNPAKPEIYYNNLNDDCNDLTKDDDQDNDGVKATQLGGMDCDDNNRDVRPGARDLPGDGIDQDCMGGDATASSQDADMDGVSEVDGDCDDQNPNISPNQPEVAYNGIDDDCKPNTKDNDIDGDGFESPIDCDDGNAQVNPNQQEVFYNMINDDCSAGTVDGDKDGDGFIAVMVAGGNDCDDNVARVNPMGMEVTYNGLDDDCNPMTKDDDLDGDGVNRDRDCDESNPDVNQDIVENASVRCSDRVDNNCVGGDVECDANAVDRDQDGIPDDQDCAPNNASIPGPMEILGNNLDDDCDPTTLDVLVPCDNDNFDLAEINDTAVKATGVEDGNRSGAQYGDLVLCGQEFDWYSIRVTAGDGLEVDLSFTHADGDIDVELYRTPGNVAINENTLILVDSSRGVTDGETVYERRASETSTYLVKVIHYQSQEPQPYQMTVNVFSGCVDDVVSATAEHNDQLSEASGLPALGEIRQVCDYDEDWYRFSVSRAGNVGIDLIFKHAQGDLDMTLLSSNGEVITSSVSTDDDESIVQMLAVGTYYVKVIGFQGAKNQYRIFKSSGTSRTARVSLANDLNIPDAGVNGPSSITTMPLAFSNIPAGAVVRKLKLVNFDLNHSFLRDLVIVMNWDAQPILNIWNRDGDANGDDAGLDDDSFFDIIGKDVNFVNRVYPDFAGLDAQGDFTVTVQDFARNNTGTLVDLEVEIEYMVP
jgi:hypothetical protein